jgi:chitodextrinase
MFRASTNASDMYADVIATPDVGVQFQWRSSAGGNATGLASVSAQVPVWLELVRTAATNTFTAYYSTDATNDPSTVNWVLIGSTTISMPTTVLGGLAASSQTNGSLNASTFTNVSAVAASGPVPAVPGTPTISTAATSSTVGISWTASPTTGVTGYIVLRSGGSGSQSFTTTTTSFNDSGLSPSTTYSYTVEAVIGTTPSAPSGALSVTTLASTVTPPSPPGTPTISTAATSSTVGISWTASPTTGVTGYIVLRSGGSGSQSFTTTGTSFNDSGLSPSTTYSYTVEAVIGTTPSTPSGALSVTTLAAPASTQLTGTVIGTTGSWNNSGNTIANVFDGNLNTFFDAPTGNGDWAGLNLGATYTITSISYAPRVGFESRMVGGEFQVSSTPDFSSNVITLATISAQPADGYTTITIPSSAYAGTAGAYQYVRYLSPNNGFGNVAEVDFFGH